MEREREREERELVMVKNTGKGGSKQFFGRKEGKEGVGGWRGEEYKTNEG